MHISGINTDKKSIKMEDYLIAYFDILGYTALIENDNINDDDVLQDIQESVNHLMDTLDFISGEENSRKLYSFSDNYAICIKIENGIELAVHLAELVTMLNELQYYLFVEKGLLIRGGISCGPLCAENRVLYGRGLLNAYKLESEKAIYPRIVIDEELIDEVLFQTKDMVEEISKEIGEYKDLKITYDNMLYEYCNVFFSWTIQKNKFPSKTIKSIKEKTDAIGRIGKIHRDEDGLYYSYFICVPAFEHKAEDRYRMMQQSFVMFVRIYIAIKENIKFEGILRKWFWVCNLINYYFVSEGYKAPLVSEIICKKTGVSSDIIDKYLFPHNENYLDPSVYELAKMGDALLSEGIVTNIPIQIPDYIEEYITKNHVPHTMNTI